MKRAALKFMAAMLLAGVVAVASEMYPAVIDLSGKLSKTTYIADARKVKEFGLYRHDKKKYPTKMVINLSQPCFIIDPQEWESYRKIDAFTVELIQLDKDYQAGFGGYDNKPPLFYNDDLPKNPVYLLGGKGCEEAPNAMNITAYQKIGGRWRKTGQALFIIKK